MNKEVIKMITIIDIVWILVALLPTLISALIAIKLEGSVLIWFLGSIGSTFTMVLFGIFKN